MKRKKTEDTSLELRTINYLKPTSVVNAMQETFKSKHDYYITLTELLWKIQKNGDNLTDTKKSITFSAEFIRAKKKRIDTTYHKNVKIKYVACAVNRNLKFDKLDKRVKILDDDKNSERVVYFIPIHFLRSLIPLNIARGDNISAEITDIGIFRYTGDVEQFRYLSIFALSNVIFLANKLDTTDRTIRIIV